MSTKCKERSAGRQFIAALILTALSPLLMAAEENGAKADKTPPAAASQAAPQSSTTEAQVKALQEKIDKQQAEIDQLLGTVDKLQQKLEGGTPSPTTTPPPST